MTRILAETYQFPLCTFVIGLLSNGCFVVSHELSFFSGIDELSFIDEVLLNRQLPHFLRFPHNRSRVYFSIRFFLRCDDYRPKIVSSGKILTVLIDHWNKIHCRTIPDDLLIICLLSTCFCCAVPCHAIQNYYCSSYAMCYFH